MKQKEKLIRQYYALKHKFDINENCIRPWPVEPSEKDIISMSREFKVNELEYKIESVENALKKQSIRIESEKYFATEEGKKDKENVENKIANLDTKQINLVIEFENWLNTEIRYMFGDSWLTRVSFGWKSVNIEIGLKNIHPENSCGIFEFGHSFNIHFDLDNYYIEKNKKPRFEMNYGTMGSFDLFDDTYRSLYLEGLGRLANNKVMLQNIFDKCNEYTIEDYNIEKEISELEEYLKNPNK